ncbi:class I fructose-bisphosphate aldolase [Paenibacillus flagellatus]|uniref:Aldolase n=1 Tax=Paenibacillus flagellatus TaxID=2211139 RepID=A0A2V5KA60_9BACL|nr:aldolase [Paenibacillus flagellatus]PYI55782.1 aldolase [Paenibacillus flagellatus]
MSIVPRMNRLFGEDGKCFDVAIDHGFFNEASFLSGIENMKKAIETIVAAGPDAIQLSPGQAGLLQSIPGKRKPSLVLRTDIANVYGKSLPSHLFSQLIQRPVEQAVALDAACVVVNLLLLPGRPELYHQCVENVCRLKPDCEKYGMPLMVEPLVMQPNETHGGYMVDGDLDKIVPLVRQAVELGADIIKADPCDDIADYHKVVEAASGKPVLPRGGGRAPDETILARTYELMRQGASGIVYGRNVIQHAYPDRMTRAFMAIVHEGATAEQALGMLKGA